MMHYPAMKDIFTARLHLRKIRMDDLENYFTCLAGSEAVTRYMLFRPHKDISESAASIAKWLARYAAGGCYHWCIALKDTDELIGVIDLLRFDEENSSCSFAYMLAEKFWGRGYGTEALRAVIDFGFAEMGLERIEADHMTENVASGAVMRKAGMVYQCMVPGKYEKNGKVYDAAVYAITRQQWFV